jgi:hypothetical protein
MYLGTPKESHRLLKNVLQLDDHRAGHYQILIALVRNTSLGSILSMFRL